MPRQRRFTNIPQVDDADRHVMLVANFIGHCDPDHIQGGISAEVAFASFCDLLQIPPGRLMNIIRGKPEQSAASGSKGLSTGGASS